MSETQCSQQGTANGSVAMHQGGPLSRLVYRSRAVNPLSTSDLYRLTIEASSRNRRESITGVMLYDDSRFFQWLEGPRESVHRVMHSIRNDRRHTDIEVLNEKPSTERAFADWNMKLATTAPGAVSFRDEVLDPPAEIMDDLRRRPDAAPAVLIKLLPRSVNPADSASAAEQLDRVPLGRATAAVLKEVILSTVIPTLARQHGIIELGAHTLPANPRAAELADLLVGSDQAAARELIDELHADEGSVWPLFSTLFEPAARSMGDLWAEDLCSEFDVTLGLCRIQTAAHLLGAHAKPQTGKKSGAVVLIAPTPGEIHQFGAALDSEVLYNAGLAPHCEYVPDIQTLLDVVSSIWFDAIDLSLSAAFQRRDSLPRLTKTIAEVRRASKNPSLVVVVGGRIFVDRKASGAQVGADVSSMTALDVADLVLSGIAKQRKQTH